MTTLNLRQECTDSVIACISCVGAEASKWQKIVGAGSAGSVLANRLSKNGTYDVLLLEAGDEMTPELYVPFMAPFSANQNNSWGYQTDPQMYALFSFPGGIGPMTQGKVLGGTSSINSMNFVRGNKHDFNKWENTYGATGWGYSNILEYFKQIEMFLVQDESVQEKDKYHGDKGETPVQYPDYHTPLSDIFLEACKELGYNKVDYNGEKHTGYSRVQCNTLKGIRMGASTCFLDPIRQQRTNLHISTKSTVTKITLDSNKKATGVEFIKDGENKKVRAKHEVIVSAGAIGSPKLLMLSGIGRKDDLQRLGMLCLSGKSSNHRHRVEYVQVYA
ncbi:glucose dehydrogenase [FAD, quinone]-like [Dermacentor silvarum]|uniref:glucose dehydrogenase [FAD, quinone]-like n=1 Tax=Dermacentor silvarum TaxID=543639 RepID=UPI002100AB61|nr:glucose dehydrogenase [FAD, quinone]-like [Dermacentor silvarum]